MMHALSFLYSMNNFFINMHLIVQPVYVGAQWLSGRVLDSRQRDDRFETHRRHCNESLSKSH